MAAIAYLPLVAPERKVHSAISASRIAQAQTQRRISIAGRVKERGLSGVKSSGMASSELVAFWDVMRSVYLPEGSNSG
jgi:hypothetical protein